MRIRVLGAGHVGGALGAALTAVGHDVVFGVRGRDSTTTRDASSRHRAHALPPGGRDRRRGGDRRRPPLGRGSRHYRVPSAARWPHRHRCDEPRRRRPGPRSATQDLADLLPGARLAKAFNTIGFENLTTARDRRTKGAMFVAGDDPDAKALAMRLAEQLAFQPEDAAGLANTKPLEELVKVWLALSQHHGRTVGFAVSDG